MRHHDRRADLVEQRDQGIAVQELLLGEIRDLRQEARHHHDGGSVVRFTGARPLRVQMRLRPELELLLLEVAPQRAFDIADARGAVGCGVVAGAAAPRLVHHVDRVALPHEILRPALAAIGRAQIGGAGTRAAVHHHDRIRMGLLGRNAILHVHLAGDDRAVADLAGLAADVEKAVARERHRRIVGRLRGPPISSAPAIPQMTILACAVEESLWILLHGLFPPDRHAV